tara:strand:+ start:16732 stop:17874 length:1143 start_codon:yes stop_codon:yes gene_type:complete
MSRRKELSGKKFGKLTVKQVSEKRGPRGELYWDCECDCGNTKAIRSSYLNKGKVQCCGCTHRGNLKGQSFGHLIVLERSEKTNSHGNVYWTCECKRCGNQKDIAANGLRSGYHKSCGCLKKTRTKESSKMIPGHIWYSIQDSAKRRNIDFQLSLQDAETLLTEQEWICPLTGSVLGFDYANPKGTNTTASLDRKDSTKPYCKDNCWWILKSINLMKGSLPLDEFIALSNYVSQKKESNMFKIEQNLYNAHNAIYLTKINSKKFGLRVSDQSLRTTRGHKGINCPDGIDSDKAYGVNQLSGDVDLMFKLDIDHYAKINLDKEVVDKGYSLYRDSQMIYQKQYHMPCIYLRHKDRNHSVFEDLGFFAGRHIGTVDVYRFFDE